MPTWRTTLPATVKHLGYGIRRTPTNASLYGIITTEDVLVCDTHYWRGRTVPCERLINDSGQTEDDKQCEACTQKVPYRTHVYVAAIDPKTREHYIFECSAHAAKALIDYRDQTGTLRGCLFDANRPKGTPNGKVVISTNTANLTRNPIPAAPDLVAALCTIWRLPRPAMEPIQSTTRCDLDTGPQARGHNRIRTNAKQLAEMRNQRDNEQDPPTMGDILQGNGHRPKPATAK